MTTNFDDLAKSRKSRHSCESRSPDAVPAKAGNQKYMNLDSCFHRKPWTPAFAGMTKMGQNGLFTRSSILNTHSILWYIFVKYFLIPSIFSDFFGMSALPLIEG